MQPKNQGIVFITRSIAALMTILTVVGITFTSCTPGSEEFVTEDASVHMFTELDSSVEDETEREETSVEAGTNANTPELTTTPQTSANRVESTTTVPSTKAHTEQTLTNSTVPAETATKFVEEPATVPTTDSIIPPTGGVGAYYDAWEKEYYYAAKTWKYFSNLGFSDAAICGIIGNMMVETSGGSLNLNPTIYDASGSYYGLCQWSLYYRPQVAGMSFERQLDYLASDMPSEFKTFGYKYYSGFNYETFKNMTSPADAAVAFAKIYERCASGSYNQRISAANKVFNYFCA